MEDVDLSPLLNVSTQKVQALVIGAWSMQELVYPNLLPEETMKATRNIIMDTVQFSRKDPSIRFNNNSIFIDAMEDDLGCMSINRVNCYELPFPIKATLGVCDSTIFFKRKKQFIRLGIIITMLLIPKKNKIKT